LNARSQEEWISTSRTAIQSLRASVPSPLFWQRKNEGNDLRFVPLRAYRSTVQSIGKLDSKTLAEFRDTFWRPTIATYCYGRLPARAELMKTVTQLFVPGSKSSFRPRLTRLHSRPAGGLLVDGRSVQADIHMVGTPTRLSPEYFPLMVGNSVLGQRRQFAHFRNIREKEASPTTLIRNTTPSATPPLGGRDPGAQ